MIVTVHGRCKLCSRSIKERRREEAGGMKEGEQKKQDVVDSSF